MRHVSQLSSTGRSAAAAATALTSRICRLHWLCGLLLLHQRVWVLLLLLLLLLLQFET
jgi:hypothetical protein